jgi:hypothetical protein
VHQSNAIAFVAAGFTPAIFVFEFSVQPGATKRIKFKGKFKGARRGGLGAPKGRRYKTTSTRIGVFPVGARHAVPLAALPQMQLPATMR